MLNTFGQTFKDNGYQLMNDRDSPIWQNPSYWPVDLPHDAELASRKHQPSSDRQAQRQRRFEEEVNTNGFDLSGLDFHTGGTLYKNYSFYVLPSSDADRRLSLRNRDGPARQHRRTAHGSTSSWASSNWTTSFRKSAFSRCPTTAAITSSITSFPLGDSNVFGQMGDNQLGIELMGHSLNDRTRYSVALVSSNDGNVNLPNKDSYATFVTVSQAFDAGYQGGVDRVGGICLHRQRPDLQLSRPAAVPVTAIGNKPFNREGLFALVYVKKLDFSLFYQHGWDSAYFGTSTAANMCAAARERRPRPGTADLSRPTTFGQSAADLHPARRIRAHGAASAARHARQFWQHQRLYVWLPLLPVHVQPRGLRLSRRICVRAADRARRR